MVNTALRFFGVDAIQMKKTEKKSGGCQCGAVRFAIFGEFGKAGICHCRMCQKAFGSWGAALVSVNFADFQWTRGTAGTFRSSQIVERGFCNTCGTPLYMREDGDQNIELAIGCLDNPAAVTNFTEQAGVESRVPWFNELHELPAQTTADYRTPSELQQLETFQHPDFDTALWPIKPKQL